MAIPEGVAPIVVPVVDRSELPRLSNLDTASLPLFATHTSPELSVAIAVGALRPPPVYWMAIVNALGCALGMNAEIPVATPYSWITFRPGFSAMFIAAVMVSVGYPVPEGA